MAEVIDFFWPNAPEKTLYVSNIIKACLDDNIITHELEELFSECGLVCDVKSFRVCPHNESETFEISNLNKTVDESYFYALVKFYTHSSAQKALKTSFTFNGSLLKIKASNRQIILAAKKLYYKKSIQLANYFLGFNGWSSKVIKLDKSEDVSMSRITFTCTVAVKILQGQVNSQGQGVGEETYCSEALESKIAAFVKAKNQAYRLSMENAFSKLLLVVLQNGKVSVHLNQQLEGIEEVVRCGEEDDDNDNAPNNTYDGVSLLQVNTYEHYVNEEEEEEKNDDDDLKTEAVLNEFHLFD